MARWLYILLSMFIVLTYAVFNDGNAEATAIGHNLTTGSSLHKTVCVQQDARYISDSHKLKKVKARTRIWTQSLQFIIPIVPRITICRCFSSEIFVSPVAVHVFKGAYHSLGLRGPPAVSA